MSSDEPVPSCILVVDDNLQNRLVAEGHLTAAGYGVVQAESGEQALEKFEAHHCDLVLLDVRMPGLDGFATLAALRRLPRGADVAVIFLTALDDSTTHERALMAGVDDYLTKPLRAPEMLMRVRSLLRVGHAMRELRASHALVSQQRDELLRARDLRRQLTAFIVHDLKSPLSMIMAATEAVQRRVSAPGVEKLQIVQRAASNMGRMVHNLLDIARSEDGRLVPQATPFDIRQLVDDLLHSLRGTHGEWHANIALEAHYRLTEPRAVADPELLRRVLENLLDNALRYSPTEARIDVTVTRSERELQLVVADQGPGIAPEQRERIFEMYVRLDRTNPERVGHGLGLVFCRLAVEAQGGRIWVTSGRDGHGAAFHVCLPVG